MRSVLFWGEIDRLEEKCEIKAETTSKNERFCFCLLKE
jgi:hypothetical protein